MLPSRRYWEPFWAVVGFIIGGILGRKSELFELGG
jgi:hypothetical protein